MRLAGYFLAPVALFLLLTGSALAQGYSLLTGEGLFAARPPLPRHAQADSRLLGARLQPLVNARAEIADTAEDEEARGAAQSLFIGRTSGGLFAPLASRTTGASDIMPDGLDPTFASDPQAGMIRDLIAQAEAGRDGYDAVQYGARRRPARPPTQMTLGEIFAWTEATPGQPHAIGRYQFIPSTLERLVNILGAGPDELFSPQMQDRLADVLLHEAGLAAYRSGEITRYAFMDNLAKIWAGLPNSSGRSHYHGFAGNVATITWDRFDSEMAHILQG